MLLLYQPDQTKIMSIYQISRYKSGNADFQTQSVNKDATLKTQFYYILSCTDMVSNTLIL